MKKIVNIEEMGSVYRGPGRFKVFLMLMFPMLFGKSKEDVDNDEERKNNTYNYRERCALPGPFYRRTVHFLRCALYAWATAWFVVILYGFLTYELGDALQFIFQGSEKARAVLQIVLLLGPFNMLWHGKGKAGWLFTLVVQNGKQVLDICHHNGDVFYLPWIGERAIHHSIGTQSITTVCRSPMTVPYKDRHLGENKMKITGGDDSPVKFTTTGRLGDPFKNTRLQEDVHWHPDGVANKYHDVVASYGHLALSAAARERLKPKDGKPGKHLTFKEVTNSATLQDLLVEGFQAMRDDEGQPKVFQMIVNNQKEIAIDTETGYNATDPHSQGMVPDPELMDSMDRRATVLFDARTEAEKLAIATGAVQAAGPDAENAMIQSGALSGEEVKINRQKIELGFPGLSGEQTVRVAETIGPAVGAAIVAFSNRGSQGGGRDRNKRRRSQGGAQPPQTPPSSGGHH